MVRTSEKRREYLLFVFYKKKKITSTRESFAQGAIRDSPPSEVSKPRQNVRQDK
jgi:hypothetical protein